MQLQKARTSGFVRIFATHISMLASTVLTLTLIATQSGCQLFNRLRPEPTIASPVAFTALPGKEQILQHLAAQSSQVNQLQTDVRVSVEGMPTLRGNLSIEKPDRMRLNAGLLGVSELGIDVGSNSEVFWFWTKVAAPGQEPGIYFARHDQFQQSALHQSIPIEPSWLIDALGLVSFEPTDRVEGPFQRPDGRLELRTYRTRGNQTTIRVTAIDPKYGWVNQQAMYDGAGNLIAHVDSTKYNHYPEHGINLPSRIIVTAYDPNKNTIKLVVDASRFRINSIYGDPAQLWTMPNPGGVPLIDLVAEADSKTSPAGQIQTSVSANVQRHRFDHLTSTSGRKTNLSSRYLR